MASTLQAKPSDRLDRWNALRHTLAHFQFRGPQYQPQSVQRWDELLVALAAVEPSGFAKLGRPSFVDHEVLLQLQREAATAAASADVEVYNEILNGQGFSGPGPAAQRMALDRNWPEMIRRTVGIAVQSSREAGYIHYNQPGAHVAPHVDGMDSDVSVLLTVGRHPDRGYDRSALILFPPCRAPVRVVLEPGEAIAIQGRGLVHAREPVRPGERVTILYMAFTAQERCE